MLTYACIELLLCSKRLVMRSDTGWYITRVGLTCACVCVNQATEERESTVGEGSPDSCRKPRGLGCRLET